MSSVQNLFKQTQEISADIQHLSHQLHSSKLQHLGLAAAMRGLCREFSKQHKIEVDCAVQDLPRPLSADAALCLFRVAQEALHNIAKHSGARKVRVELGAEADQVRLKVSDDGVGFDLQGEKSHSGLGLVSMSERMRLVSGELATWSRPTFGTQVTAPAPFPYEQPEIHLVLPDETTARIA
jgi:signal transduction histidine kinase